MNTIRRAVSLVALAFLAVPSIYADSPTTTPSSSPPKFSSAASSKMAALTGVIMNTPPAAASADTTSAKSNPAPAASVRTAVPKPTPALSDDMGSTDTQEHQSRNVAPKGYVDSTLLPDERSTVRQRLLSSVDSVDLADVSAKQAVNWWSNTTGVPIVVNWDSLTNQSIDPETKINLSLHRVQAVKLLGLIMQQASLDKAILLEESPTYVQIMTKTDADKNPIVELYDVNDLIDVPVDPFPNAPHFDLSSALSASSSSGGSSGSSPITGGGGGVFGGTETKPISQAQQIENLCKLIRETVEPEAWAEAGGSCSIRFFRGSLIVKAPLYVQVQIGMPSSSLSGDEERNHVYIVNAAGDK